MFDRNRGSSWKANIIDNRRVQGCNMNYLRFQSVYFERLIIDIDFSWRRTMDWSRVMGRMYQGLICVRYFVWISWGIDNNLFLSKCLRPECFALENILWFLFTTKFDIDFTSGHLLSWRYAKGLRWDIVLFQLRTCASSSFQRRH